MSDERALNKIINDQAVDNAKLRAESRQWLEVSTKAIVERDQALGEVERLRGELSDQCTYSAHLLSVIETLKGGANE